MSRFRPADGKVLHANIYSYLMMALYAMLLNMVGEILPPVMEEFGLTMARAGFLQVVFNIGGIVVLTAMLYFSDRIRKSRLVYYSFLFTSAVMAIVGLLATSYFALATAFLILGATTKVFDVSVNAYVNDINTRGREFYFQLLHMSFGIGAAFGPVYASFIIRRNFGWRTTLWFLAAVYFVLLLVSAVSFVKQSAAFEIIRRKKHENLSILPLLKDPQVWILFIGAGCFSGTYAGLITWFPTYARALGENIGNLSGVILSVYFIGYIISRGIASFILTEKNTRFLIILTSMAGSLLFLTSFIIATPMAFFTLLPLAGFFSGATLPMIISAACLIYPRKSGGVTTILYIGISVFAMVTPYLMGVIGDAYGIGRAMPLIAYLMLIASVVSLLIRKSAD